MFLVLQAEATEVICRPCWQQAERRYRRLQRAVHEPDVAGEGVNTEPHDSPTTLPGFYRTGNSANTCVFQHCENVTRRRIPENIILRVLCRYSVFITENSRVCNEHFDQGEWHLLALQDLIHQFNAAQIVSALRLLVSHINTDVLDFENYEIINDKEFHDWTGLTIEQFRNLLENTPSLNQRKNKKTILAALLAKLRTGDSNARLASIFKTSEATYSRLLHIGREALLHDFVPSHLGFDHMNREDVARRNLMIPERIFGNPGSPSDERKAITIIDGTYIYIYKRVRTTFFKESPTATTSFATY